MLYLKEANIDDMQKEYEVITRIPFDENGLQMNMKTVLLKNLKKRSCLLLSITQKELI